MIGTVSLHFNPVRAQGPPNSMHLATLRPRRMHAPCRRHNEMSLQRSITTHAAKQQAVVIGSGMAGLCTAQILSRHFDSVTVLERDRQQPVWDSNAIEMINAKGTRRGVTQYHHLHGLSAGGLVALNNIFNGEYLPALQAAGAHIVDLVNEGRMSFPDKGTLLSGYTPKEELTGAYCTRHVFESCARHLVSNNPRITLKWGGKVEGLVMEGPSNTSSSSSSTHSNVTSNGVSRSSSNGSQADVTAKVTAKVTGVTLSDGSTVSGDLVVDCAGRSSLTPQWLEAGGFGRVRVSHVTANCGYATYLAQLSPEAEQRMLSAGVQCIYCRAVAPERTLGIIMHAEDNMWLVGVGGYEKEWPPMKDDELQEFAETKLWNSEISDLIKGSKRLAPAVRFFDLGSTWRHYEEVTLPENLIVMADSICSFQPVHGQGMTVAAREAVALDRIITQRNKALSGGEGLELEGLSNQWQQTALPIVKAAWDLATGEDLRFESATSSDGPRPNGFLARCSSAYQDALLELATYDPMVNEVFTRVAHVLDDPQRLASPDIVGRVITHQMKKAFTGLIPSSKSNGTDRHRILPSSDSSNTSSRSRLGLVSR